MKEKDLEANKDATQTLIKVTNKDIKMKAYLLVKIENQKPTLKSRFLNYKDHLNIIRRSLTYKIKYRYQIKEIFVRRNIRLMHVCNEYMHECSMNFVLALNLIQHVHFLDLYM